MNRSPSALLAAFVALLLVSACGGGGGGGGGGGESAPPPESPTSFSIQGTAATGAPLSGAAIEIRDSTGAMVASTVASAQGSYTLTVPLAARAPFVVSASAGGVTLFSPVASQGVTTVNVTPVTTVIAAQLSPTGDPAQLASQLQLGTASFDAARVSAVVSGLVQALKPLLDSVGTNIDPITGTFSADGTGYDRVLNSLLVTIRPTGAEASITISVKAAPADNSQPPEITFAAGTEPPVLPASAGTVTLPPTNLDTMLAAFAAKLQECMALPLAQRVTGTTATDTIQAPACRQVFFDDDPGTYKDSGANARSDWPVIFGSAMTGMKVSPPVLRILEAGGTMLVSWSNTTTSGDLLFLRAVLKPQGDVLKAIGNQHDIGFRVRAWSETRTFLNTPEFSYRDTGFTVTVDNVTQSGASLFDRVEVTTPGGRKVVLRPQAGLSYMSLVRPDGSLTGTSVLRLAGRFLDEARTTQPRTLTGENIFWASNPSGANADWTDAEVAAINNLGRWKADFFLAGNTGSTPDATQFATTTVRASTLTELALQPVAALTADLRADLVAASSATGSVALMEGERVNVVGDSDGPGWAVPAGALPPTLVQVQGFVSPSGARWNDNLLVSPSSRSTGIPCLPQTVGDAHCSVSATGAYSAAARLNLIQLFGNDINDMQWVSTNALFRVQQP